MKTDVALSCKVNVAMSKVHFSANSLIEDVYSAGPEDVVPKTYHHQEVVLTFINP